MMMMVLRSSEAPTALPPPPPPPSSPFPSLCQLFPCSNLQSETHFTLRLNCARSNYARREQRARWGGRTCIYVRAHEDSRACRICLFAWFPECNLPGRGLWCPGVGGGHKRCLFYRLLPIRRRDST